MLASASPVPRGITLFTSLPPKIKRTAAGRELGAVYQRECIASWRSQGFEIVSLNARAEIEALLPLSYEVTFKEVASTRPRIYDFLTIIKEEPAAVAGIINADCMMVANDPAISLVLQFAKQGLVLVERLNIGADDLRATGVSCCGFDLLLFAKRVLDDLEFDPEISIGTPWWDYWFPIAYRLAGGQLFTVPAPMLMHLDHPQSWSWENWLADGRKMHDSLARIKKSDSSFPFVKYDQTNELSKSEALDFAIATFQWLKTAPHVIQMEDPSAWLWCSLLAGIDSVPKQATDAERGFEEAKRGFEEAERRHEEAERRHEEAERRHEEAERRHEEAERRHEEAERRLKDSLSWKVTRPLRGIEKMLSRIRLPTSLRSFLKRSMGA
jgi:hypothetical protein